MKRKFSQKARRQLAALAGMRTNSEAEVDELLGILLQLSLALMMIFMVAFCLFRLDTVTQLTQVQRQQEEQLLSEQRQKLIMALERTEDFFLTRYGLKIMTEISSNNTLIYNGGLVIENGVLSSNRVLREAFVQGGSNAYNDYSSPDLLAGRWKEQVLATASIREEELQTGNQEYLNTSIRDKQNAVFAACKEVQLQAALAVQNHLSTHPEEARSDRVKALVEQYIAAPAETRGALLEELTALLKRYAYEYLKNQTGTPMLEELP